MKIKPNITIVYFGRKVVLWLSLFFLVNIVQAQIVCGPVNTLYQTIGQVNGVNQTITKVYRYNAFQQSYIEVGELGGSIYNAASNSAYNATTQLIYSSAGGTTVRVYDPADGYKYKGDIIITGNSKNFNNTLFAYQENVGFVNDDKVVLFDVTGLSLSTTVPATVSVTEKTFPNQSGSCADYALIGDEIYGVTGSTLRVINISDPSNDGTATVTNKSISFDNSLGGGATSSGFGATWQDRNGNFYCFNNGNGSIYKITDILNAPASNVSAVKVLLANSSGINDGFGCELGPDPLDWDDDGKGNSDDIDDDNDGILDVNESPIYPGIDPGGDEDNDRVYNYRDTDDPSIIGVALFVDINSDGINDNFDFDLDGVPNSFDLDSDNDGIPDNIEAQPTVGYIAPTDLGDVDDDNDGLNDAYDDTPTGNPNGAGSLGLINLPNIDGTGNVDFLDVDADDDGLYDTHEAGITLSGDTDGDGLDDAVDDTYDVTDPNGTINDPTSLPDDDSDVNSGGDVDYRDSKDSDNDGVLDADDLDDDNDGILDLDEYPGLDPLGDEDGDGIYNYADANDNGSGDGSTTNYTDADNNGIPDAFDVDGDGIPNHLDLDSDGDLCNDVIEAENLDPDNDGIVGNLPTTVDSDGKVTGGLPIDGAYNGTNVDVTTHGGGVITTQPTASVSTICLGTNATFMVVVTGGELVYKWQERIGVASWTDLSDGGIYSNTTTASLTLITPPIGHSGRKYRVLITSTANICTDLTSDEVELTVDPISVGGTATAGSSTICSGETTTISLNGSTGSIQWQTNASGSYVDIPGATSASYTTPTLTSTTSYKALVTSGVCSSVSSSEATVTIDPLSVGGTATAGSSTICSGETTTISLSGSTGSIQWQTNASGSYVDIPEATSASYTTPTLTSTTSYKALVTSGVCSSVSSSEATVTVNTLPPTPVVTSLLQNVCPLKTADLTVNATGSGGIILYRTVDDPNGTAVVDPSAVLAGTYYIFEKNTTTGCTSNSASIVVTIINCAPSQGNENLSVDEDSGTSTSENLVANNIDPDGTTATVTAIVSSTGGGTTSISGSGTTIDYEPQANFNGTDTVVYTVCDAGIPSPAACVNDTLFVTVNPVNDAPSQGNENLSVDEDSGTSTSENLVANNIDPDGTTTIVTAIVSSTGGGTTSISGSGTTIDYEPQANFNGTDTVVYTVCDAGIPSPAACVNDTLFVTVNPVNDAPSQGNENLSVGEDSGTSTSENLVANNIDPDGTTATVTAIVSSTGGGPTSISGSGTTIDYEPQANFNGTDTVVYTVCDAGIPSPAACVNDTLFVTVNPVNDAPSQGNENLSVDEDSGTSTSENLVANNIDPDGTTATVTAIVSSTGGGTTSISGSGTTIDYEPQANFNGTDTVVYTVCDAGIPSPASCVNDTLFVTVNPVNDAPSQGNENLSVGEDSGTSTSENLVANNIDPDGTTATVTAIVSSTGGGPTSISGSGTTIDYEPQANFNGTDTVVYTVCDAGIPGPASCVNDTLFVTVNPVNDAPSQGNENLSVGEDSGTSTSENLVANNIDPDGTTTIVTAIVSSTGGGTTSISGSGTTIDYEPQANFNGTDTVVYTVCDAGIPSPAACVNDTLFVTVNPVNDAPSQGNENLSVGEDSGTSTSENLVANNIDPDGTTATVTAIVSSTGGGTTSISGSGTTIDYEPQANFNGTDTVVYTVCDAGIPSPASCVNDTLFVTVNPVNDAPSQGNENLSVGEDSGTSTSENLVANNIDPDGTTATVTAIVSSTGGGTTSISGSGTTIDYEPQANFNGTDTVVYTVCDAGIPSPAACVNDTLFVTVNPVPTPENTNPVANSDSLNINSGNTEAVIDVQLNDIDADGDELITTILVGPKNGTANVIDNDSILFEPIVGWKGQDTIIYQVCDSFDACDSDTVFITVIENEENSSPVANDDEFVILNGNSTSGNLMENDYAQDSNQIHINTVPLIDPEHGILRINEDGSFSYTPEEGFYSLDSFVYEVCNDGTPRLCDQAIVKIQSLIDSDYDGIPDFIDTDDDNDGISDMLEGEVDSDDDGLPDYLDIDSDNDGITDNEEAQAEGKYIEPLGKDSDGDGLDDAYDLDNGGEPLVPFDTDNDGIPDYLDLDSDDDTVPDNIEGWDSNADGIADYLLSGSDSDGDGLDDAFDSVNGRDNPQNSIGSKNPLQNHDGDNYRDWRDDDDDNDGRKTRTEYRNASGLIMDTDQDGIPDYLDTDFICVLNIPDGFSPNGDQFNELFRIEFICDQGSQMFEEEYPNARIEIYNRWGNLVYEQENYGNTQQWGDYEAWWNGESTNSLQMGKDKLPAATYFYILHLNDGSEAITGAIFLNN